MHTYFPYLICSDNELEIINEQRDLNDYLHSLTAEQQQHCVILNKQGEYFDLAFNLATPLTNIELARRVTQHLAQEGHCCLTKITSLTAFQAFDLLGIK